MGGVLRTKYNAKQKRWKTSEDGITTVIYCAERINNFQTLLANIGVWYTFGQESYL